MVQAADHIHFLKHSHSIHSEKKQLQIEYVYFYNLLLSKVLVVWWIWYLSATQERRVQIPFGSYFFFASISYLTYLSKEGNSKMLF